MNATTLEAEAHCYVIDLIYERCRIKLHDGKEHIIKSYLHSQPFELIFCRNVMIYFDRATQEQLVNRLCQLLVPHGHLLIGHSESLTGLNVPLRCVRPSIYQRI